MEGLPVLPDDVILGDDLDALFNWPPGRSERLAKRGVLPHYALPDGEVRFSKAEVLALVEHRQARPGPTIHTARAPRHDLRGGL
jgi:hypothetical protein